VLVDSLAFLSMLMVHITLVTEDNNQHHFGCDVKLECFLSGRGEKKGFSL
jgi:hypothetical protein